MNKLYQTVPWFNSLEWHEVYEKLYYTDSTVVHKKEAIDFLRVWKARCPFLPAGIESTLCLLEVYIQDNEESNDPHSDQLLRLAYATSLMRFVNHMLDKETAKGSSLYKAAKNLGIPDWIVDLRHDTAHGNKLPSIDLLREGCTVSLNWLKINYWDQHKDGIKDYLSGIESANITIEESKIVALLNFCISLSILSHSSCNIKNLAQIPNDSMKESLINDANELFGNSLDLSNPKTVSISGLSNLMYGQAKKLLNEESALCVNKTLLSENALFLSLEVCKVFGYDIKKNKPLSRQYLQCFEGLLCFLHTHDLIQDFISELINITSQDQNNAKCKLAAQWVSVILESLLRCQTFLDKLMSNKSNDLTSKGEEELRNLYYHWYPSEKNNCLLLNLTKPIPKDLRDINFIQPIVSTYNPYLSHFVYNLLQLIKPQIPQHIADKICKLANVISSPEGFSVLSSKIYTAEDIKMESDIYCETNVDNDIAMDIKETVNNNNDIWQIASKKYDWSTCPLGSLPFQNT